jgi:hypothetical protein
MLNFVARTSCSRYLPNNCRGRLVGDAQSGTPSRGFINHAVKTLKTFIHTKTMHHTHLIWALAAGIIVLFICCLILGIKLYRVMADNATLQYQNACFTAETAQEKTFAEIYRDLTKIIKEIRQINRRLGNQRLIICSGNCLSTENTPLKQA